MPIPLGILAVAGAGSAGGGGAYDLLETTVLTTSASSVTFSSLGFYSAYKHLQIRWTLRNSSSDQFTNATIRFNNDSAANYAIHRLFGNGSSVISAEQPDLNAMNINLIATNGYTAGVFSAGVTDILDFSSSSKNKTIRTLHGLVNASLVTQVTLQSGFRNNTEAITSVSYIAPHNFLAGSRFSLYGIK